MKTKRILLFLTANLTAIILIAAIVNRKKQLEMYGDRFRPNSFIMTDSVNIYSNVEEVYNFYISHYHEIYPQTAEKHLEFRLINAERIAPGTRIYCLEGDKTEMVYHTYLVRKAIPNKLIYKSSEPSIVRINTKKGIRENKCNAFVYVDFKDRDENQMNLQFTIIVQMPNYLYKILGRIIGGKTAKREWESHLKEELEGFRNEFYRAKKFQQLRK